MRTNEHSFFESLTESEYSDTDLVEEEEEEEEEDGEDGEVEERESGRHGDSLD